MKKELQKVYEPQQVESRIYEMWENAGCFSASPAPKKKPFSIVMPPPNVVTTQYAYSAFTGIFYCRDVYLLFLPGKRALLLPERSRTGGNSPELRRFLEEKTGMPVRTIK